MFGVVPWRIRQEVDRRTSHDYNQVSAPQTQRPTRTVWKRVVTTNTGNAVADLRLVLVTPEKTMFDRSVASIRLPMFDGSAGIFPRRAPLVGRLGVGELKVNDTDGSSESYFVDSGFIQVKNDQVSVLTQSAQPLSEIDRRAAQAELDAANAESAVGDAEFAVLAHRLERARKLVSLSSEH